MTDLATLEGYVEGRTFDDTTTITRPLSQVEFEGCTFEGVVFDEAVLRRCRFADCRFDDCSLSLVTWPDTTLTGCEFVACRIVGTSFAQLAAGALADPCRFDRTRLHLCSLTGRNLARWEFTDCAIDECDVDDSDLRHAVLRDCDLDRTTFRSCDLREADLTGSRNLALDVRENKVAGLVVDAAAAGTLLAPFGIRLV